MQLLPTVELAFDFTDRENNASCKLYLPVDTPKGRLFDFVTNCVGVFAGISDASIVTVSCYYRLIPPSTVASSNSSITRNLMLFCENDSDEISALVIPSPRPELFENSGPYAGVRVNLLHPAIVNFRDDVLGFLRTETNQPVGSLITGGLAI